MDIYRYVDPKTKREYETVLIEVIEVCNCSLSLLTPDAWRDAVLVEYRDTVTYNTPLNPENHINDDNLLTFISSAHQFVTAILRKPNTGFYKRNKKSSVFEKIATESYGYRYSSDLFLRRGRDEKDEIIYTEATVINNIKRLLNNSEIIDSNVINTPQIQAFMRLVNYICHEERSAIFPKLSEKSYADYMQNLWPQADDEQNDYDPYEYPDSISSAQIIPSKNLKEAFMRMFQKKGSPKPKEPKLTN